MPIYEYSCGKCSEEFELLVRGGEDPKCPACGGGKLQKLLSVPAAHTKTGGGLPVCESPREANCGLPACGTGGCQFG